MGERVHFFCIFIAYRPSACTKMTNRRLKMAEINGKGKFLLKPAVCYCTSNTPKWSGRWKSGSSMGMGKRETKWGVGRSSPHL